MVTLFPVIRSEKDEKVKRRKKRKVRGNRGLYHKEFRNSPCIKDIADFPISQEGHFTPVMFLKIHSVGLSANHSILRKAGIVMIIRDEIKIPRLIMRGLNFIIKKAVLNRPELRP